MLLTALGTVIPGLGLVAAGKRRLGLGILSFALVVVLLLGGLALFRTRDLMHLAVDDSALNIIAFALVVIGLAWVTLIVVTYRSLRPWRISPLARGLGSGLVVVLALVVMMPLAYASRLVTVHDQTIETIFASDDIRSETRPKNVSADNPWGGEDRVNLLLLGGDGAANRKGVRTDTVMVASIDTESGDTSLFSLPRNLQQVPFKPGSKLCEAYPECTFDPGRPYTDSAEEAEYLLTALYENVPGANPGLLDSDNPGADAMKEAVGEALGLRLDYYLLVNLEGFEKLVDALGGITVNVNYPVPIGGDTDAGIPPDGYIDPGANKHLDGENALWFARGRYGLDDYQRMERQRCTMQAIIDQANPRQVLQRYEAIATASQDIVRTDIPKSLLGAFVDLSLEVKDAEMSSRTFTNELIDPVYPDYEKIRAEVQNALGEAAASESGSPNPDPGDRKSEQGGDGAGESGDAGESSGSGDTDGSGGSDGGGDSDSTEGGPEERASDESGGSPDDPCAYNPSAYE